MEFITEFKRNNTEAERLAKYEKFRVNNPNRVPVIVDRGNKETPMLNALNTKQKNTFLFLANTQFHNCIQFIRKRLKLEKGDSLFVFVHGSSKSIPGQTETMGAIHKKHKDPKDNILYLVYTKENTFG